MTLVQRYSRMVSDGRIVDDPAQARALARLDRLRAELEAPRRAPGILARLFSARPPPQEPGIYLHGGVGTGKSMLMDIFFEAVRMARKRRVHFHAFMQEMHDAVHAQRQSGARDALLPVIGRTARETRLLCLDEVQVTDIADAMIVGRLFEGFLDAGMTIVTTSNQRPGDLYRDGLNRKLFLPFIALIGDRLDVLHLDSDTDHRQQHLRGERRYFWPNDRAADEALDKIWNLLTGGISEQLLLRNKGRDILLPEFRNGVARADFSHLCGSALGPGDYLVIARSIRLLLLTGIPKFGDENRDSARRFVTLVDALYDSRVPLVASAAAAPEDLYPTGRGAFEFRRTASRLAEMQRSDWCGGARTRQPGA